MIIWAYTGGRLPKYPGALCAFAISLFCDYYNPENYFYNLWSIGGVIFYTEGFFICLCSYIVINKINTNIFVSVIMAFMFYFISLILLYIMKNFYPTAV